VNRTEAEDVLHQITGIWPGSVSGNETAAWMQALWPLDEQVSNQTVARLRDVLVNGNPRTRRPNVSEFLAIYRPMYRSLNPAKCDEPQERPTSHARTAWWLAQCRAIQLGVLTEPDHSTWEAFALSFEEAPYEPQPARFFDKLWPAGEEPF
jgi:hypothetical protein